MVGDSITATGPWPEMFPIFNIANRGLGGDATLGVLNCMEDVLLTTRLAVFVMVGINDVSERKENDTIF